MDFGKAILRGIAGSRMKRKDVALALGVSTHYIHDLCNNNKRASIPLLLSMCELFDVKLSTFISWGE
jgi:DNA-binding XRE family transcriptional regulator